MTATAGSAGDAKDTGWGMLALAWLLYFAFGLVSAALAPLVSPIRADLHLSYAEVGFVLGFWQLVYIAAAAPVGVVIDRLGTKRALLFGALAVALSGFARSLAVDFVTLLAAVAIFGVGGPIISVGLPKLVAEWFTGGRRSLASGVYATGSAVGNVAALALTNSLVVPLLGSWRAALQLYGVLSLLIAIGWLLLGRAAPTTASGGRTAAPRARARDVMAHPAVVPIVVIGFAGFLANHSLRNWLPQIFEAKGLSPATAGGLAAIPSLTGIVGSIVVLRLAGSWGRRPITVAMLAAIGLSSVTLAVTSGAPAIAAVVVFGFAAGAFTPLLLNTLMEIPDVGAGAMGAAAGLYFAVGEMGGFLGPTALGVLKDTAGSFQAGLFALAAVMALMLVPALRLNEDVRRRAPVAIGASRDGAEPE
ncbi:MAG TPA: MFS transporter [Thermomicrobiaceae bacterium]|nr:MFS transporter [Thermomicrobiaceae bacterium]